MKILNSYFLFICIAFLAISCSKKVSPTQTNNTTANTNKLPEEKVEAKPDTSTYIVKRKVIKTAVPKVITVNDVAAKKTVDGRLYYDLNGKRYWRNKRDGKYYLYNKSMYNDPDFKP